MVPETPPRRCTLLIATLALALGGACAQEAGMGDGPATGLDIRGSYELTSRELPDGTSLERPEVYGFMTYTDRYRHFHIYFPGPEGEPTSSSFVASYELGNGEYAETTHYMASNNQPAGSGLTHDLSPQEFSTPATVTEEEVQFQDGEQGPVLVFTDQGLTATLEGEFVDHWIRLE